MVNFKGKTFAEYHNEAHLWITLSTGEFYPDVLPFACELYQPVLVLFGQMLKSAHSSSEFFRLISETQSQWMRIQLCRVFRKYVSPDIPVEMLKKKRDVANIIERYGYRFRKINEVQKRFLSRKMPDEALCAILWEYKSRGQKGYELTERLFSIIRENYPMLIIEGPERAGKDILLGDIFNDYPTPDRPVDFVMTHNETLVAIGLARYDSDRGGSQEDDRTGQYKNCANEVLSYAKEKGLSIKVIFLNDGPGLLLGSMWRDYASIEESFPEKIKVVTLRMFIERITMKWLLSK